MNRFWSAAQAGLLFLEPETAHEASLRVLEAGFYPKTSPSSWPLLQQTLFGLDFPNPIGIAAGYDKNARVYNALFNMGFGFAEVGTLTPKPQPGNPKPRVFRLMHERGIINRLGFNGKGHDAALARIASDPPRGILGINIGANKESTDPIADYVRGVAAFGRLASYLAINVSSPNTPGLRDLQAPDRLALVLDAVTSERQRLGISVPILVKLAPDIHDGDVRPIVDCIMSYKIDGVILTNTTLARDHVPSNSHRGESGGLSGRPLFLRSTRFLALVYRTTEGKIPLIGVGGVDSGQRALDKVRAGASLIQLYTGLVYEGAGLVSEIAKTISSECERTSARLNNLVGVEADRWCHVPLP